MTFTEMTSEQMTKEVKEAKLYDISCRMHREFSRSGYSKKWESLNRHYEFTKNN